SRVTGCAVLAIAVAFAAVIAAGVGVSVAVSDFFDKPEIPAAEKLGKKAGLTEYRLQQALNDGELTDQEIAHAAGGRWVATRNNSGTRVVVGYEPGPTCYKFALPASSGPTATVHRTQIDHCPALPNTPN
ncbi:hypothetical protein ACFWNT_45770, partial [Streptomyces sp. NPDC058409]|uniref:hypothetical protein n=1 Tax=Streptomyces sp. NPDC058409 TaxID=3346484 RepID=UPI00365F1F52